MSKFESMHNVSKSYVFTKKVPAGAKGYIEHRLVAHGTIDKIRIGFAAGENGTLQIRPVQIIPQEIIVDLLSYADGGDKYITGDDEVVNFDVRFETENNALLRVYYDNTGTDDTADSVVNVVINVTYFEFIEPLNVIG